MTSRKGAAPRPAGERRTSRRFENKRNAIIGVAIERLNANGVRGLTFADVAGRLGLVPTAIAYYFRTRESLAEAVFLQTLERHRELIERSRSGESVQQRVHAFVAGYADLLARGERDEGEALALFDDIRALQSQPVFDAYVAMFRSARALLALDGLSRAERNSRAHVLVSVTNGARWWLQRWEQDDYPLASARMADLLLNGFVAPDAPWPTPAAAHAPVARVDRDATHDAFLDAATDLINAEGYHGASVERISAKLNVTKGAFYHHHETKDDLVLACFRRTAERMWQTIRAADRNGGSGLQRLVSVATTLTEQHLGGQSHLLRTTALSTVPPPLRAAVRGSFDRLANRFAATISDGIADGSLRPVDVNLAAEAFSLGVNAVVELPHWVPGITARDAVEHYLKPLFRGLTSPAG
jgi:AcrR family transcriptional regulator